MKVIVEKAINYSIKELKNTITDIARKVELIIVVGKKENVEASNMYEASLQECGNAMLVESLDDVYLNYVRRFRTIGVIQDGNVSQSQIESIVNVLENTQVEGYIYGHFK